METEAVSHHTKCKGDLGVLKAQVDLYEQGFTVCVPLTEHAPFDLAAYRDQRFWRVQVKYRALGNHGAISVRFSSSWADRHGTHTVPTDKGQVDLFCIFCPDTDQCYYVEPHRYRSDLTLRVKTPKNGQAKGVRLAPDFRRVP
jgi:hypothetical protein